MKQSDTVFSKHVTFETTLTHLISSHISSQTETYVQFNSNNDNTLRN